MIRKILIHLVPAVLAVLLCTAAESTKAPVAPWTTYQANALHTGYVPVTLNPSRFKELWSVVVGSSGAALQQVTEADGMIYLSQSGYFSDQGLYVLSSKDGSTLWSLLFPDIYSVNPPAYDNGNIYIQTVDNAGNSWVRGYEAASGTPVFQSAQGAQWENYLAPTIVDHKCTWTVGRTAACIRSTALPAIKTGLRSWPSTICGRRRLIRPMPIATSVETTAALVAL